MRTVLLTGDDARHRYAARAVAAVTDLVGVVSEAKVPLSGGPTLPPEEEAVLRRHFDERLAAEARLLGPDAGFPSADLVQVARGEVNSPAVLAWIARRRPDLIILYGTGIVRDPLLSDFAGRMINIHLGLSPYYRGSATNFWPLVLEQPECVGATIHLVAAEVDAGGILAQVRPDAEPSDRGHDLGTKALVAALARLPGILPALLDGTARPVAQDLARGRVFRRRDFGPAAVRRLWANLEGGMMPEYLRHRADRCAGFPIVDLV